MRILPTNPFVTPMPATRQGRRRIVRAAALVLPAALAPAAARAQGTAFPSRGLRLVVPYAAGGIADVLARLIAPPLAERYRQPVVVENRPGASGHIGADQVAKGPTDGHTLMIATIAHNAASSMYANLPYEPDRDLQPVVLIAESASVLVVHPGVPARTVADFIALARSAPGRLNYGSAGNGSAIHMATELFRSMAGVELTHVAYKGGAPALADLLGGQIQLMFENVATALPHVQAGRIRALGVTSPARNPSLPDVPTIAEAGVPGYASVPWYTVSVARGVPADLVRRLAADLDAVIRSPELAPRWQAIGLMPLGGSPQDAVKRNADETARWKGLIRAAGIKAD